MTEEAERGSQSASNAALDARVLSVVKASIAESLAVPEAEIEPKSRLIDDLGADSLDFVDIVFMLDQKLEIKVKDSEFNFLTRLDFSSPEVMKAGFLTEPIVLRLANWLPELAAVHDKESGSTRRDR